jgi:NAD(P)-dependent dehydrogenase (short-subunit alcohol dehydrogenase family)
VLTVGLYLVTGASRGIGRAVLTSLVGAGHEVIGVFRTADSASAWPSTLRLAGVWVADLGRPEALAAAVGGQATDLSRLDGVVHCAGLVRPAPLTVDSLARDLTDQFAVNVTAVAELTRLVLPALRAAEGTAVFVNSGSGLAARSPLGGYGVSKYALRGYADALRQEEPSIRVSTVFPGRTATEMQRTVRSAEGGGYDQDDYLQPDTVAGVICSVLALPADGVITEVVLRPR